MVEPSMFFALGFLAATLLALAVIPLVHDRAERLTLRRVEGSIPMSVAEMHADKDQLRAEFAMSTRRLELSIDELKRNTVRQQAELGQKVAAISRLKSELAAKTATISALSRRHRLSERDINESIKAEWLREVEHMFSDREAKVVKLNAELDERSRTADTQRIEIAALKIQIGGLRHQLSEFEKHHSEERIDSGTRAGILRQAG